MKASLKEKVLSVFLILSLLVTTVSGAAFIGTTQGKAQEYSNDLMVNEQAVNSVPEAREVGHDHNSLGWTCTSRCKITEHSHKEACYDMSAGTNCNYHAHDDSCYNEGELVCGKLSTEAHTHELSNGCYELTCETEEIEGEHTHTIEAGCYKLICKKQEGDEHIHELSCYNLICNEKEHTHGEDQGCDLEWTCHTEYKLLTVEYYLIINYQRVRVSAAYQALLELDEATKKAAYSVPIVDLRQEGYKGYQIAEITRFVRGEEDHPETIDSDKVTDNILTGEITEDTKIVVDYVYEDDYAPYQVNYWGYEADGSGKKLLYSFIGRGEKDTEIETSQSDFNTRTISSKVNVLMRNLYDILGQAELKVLDQGEEFINKLLEAVNEKYLTGDEEDKDVRYHDITPLLRSIAGVKANDDAATQMNKLHKLTRIEIKQFVADCLIKGYSFDQKSGQSLTDKLMITADGKAMRNLDYAPAGSSTVLFMSGVPNTKVKGVPTTVVPAQPDEDGITLNYPFQLEENFITTLPDVDISPYIENIYAENQGYTFVGWVSGKNAKPITDYSPANATGKYKDVTIYTAEGSKAQIPEGIKTVPLKDALKIMPEGGATYYGVWQPFGSTYVVQIWFESKKGDNTYVEKHTLDMIRSAKVDETVTFKPFDIDRAVEMSIIEKANDGTISDNPVRFVDDESGTVDEYYSYASYMDSPFFGFDFLMCDVCKADPDKCGTAGCTCGKQRKTNADGSEGAETSKRACNYEAVKVNASGETVLNLYYTREMWEIAVNPQVQLWTADCLLRPTEFNIYTYWTGGKYKTDIQTDLQASSEADYVVIKGKYGTAVGEAYKNGVGYDQIGTFWQSKIVEQSVTIPADTPILLANGSEAFQSYDDHPEWKGCYLYPQDTIKYINGGTIPAHEDWSIPFSCLSTIEPEMFTAHTAQRVDEDDVSKGYIPILNKAPMWQGSTFSSESVYDLVTDSYTYGTHRLNLYPQYHAISDKEEQSIHQFNIDYYLQALPHEEAAAPFAYETKNKDQMKFVKSLESGEEATVILHSPASKLAYGADTPEGFVPLMWRTSPQGFKTLSGTWNRGGFQGLGTLDAVYRYGCPQVSSTGLPNQIAFQALGVDVKFPSGTYMGRDHNASFNKDHLQYLNGNTVYRSDWRQWYALNRPTQEGATVGSMDPGGYWIIDWIRAGLPGESTVQVDGSLTGENGLYDLIQKADEGNKDAQILLEQLESEFSIGMLFPKGENEVLYYHRSNAKAFRYSSGGFVAADKLVNCENAVAFARNQYFITYNTCYVDDDGKLEKDKAGNIVVTPIYKTSYTEDDSGVITGSEDMVYYDQPLGYNPKDKNNTSEVTDFDVFYDNYYDAYFTFTGDADNSFEFNGYGNQGGKGDLGGYGKWYLDPDGTIPFTEENMKRMPAGNVDVYFHYNNTNFQVCFIDKVTGADAAPLEVIINGEEKTLRNVINHQVVAPNTKAETFNDLTDPDNPNHAFVGWFYDEAGTKPFSFDTEITGDTILYAVWKEKIPTDYKIQHILLGSDNKVIGELKSTDWMDSYIGNTIDSNALEVNELDKLAWEKFKKKGTYFKVDNYSQTMVLEAQTSDHGKNIMSFYYTLVNQNFTVEYRDISSKSLILDPLIIETELKQAAVGMKEIPNWEYKGYSVDDSQNLQVPDTTHVTIKITPNGVVVTFWYERIPTEGAVTALKWLDDVLCQDEWFEFELVDDKNQVVGKTSSIDGVIEFEKQKLNVLGTYWYTLREVKGDGHFIYDDTVFKVKMDVTQKSTTSPLECEISYYNADGTPYIVNGGIPIFKNKRKPAEIKLTAEKYVNGKPMTGTDFEFVLQGGEGLLICDKHISHNESCYSLALICKDPDHEHDPACYEKKLTCTKTEEADHKHGEQCYEASTTEVDRQPASDGMITFDLKLDRPGVYVYTLHEFNDGDKNCEYDEGIYRIEVEVFINDKNELDKEVTIMYKENSEEENWEFVDSMRFDNVRRNPIVPTGPDEPDEPDDPDKPVKPDKPIKPDKPDNLGPVDQLPKTGDKTNLLLWLVLMGMSILGIGASVYISRKEENSKS